ncbi:MAG: DNA-binding response regulator [Verrucomicrobia bacterium]|nr:MAG: DNA-binding response regulator [Verrucomicrobiota bacterium]
MKTVVVIEDQTAIREMLAEFIRMTPGYDIIDMFGDGQVGLDRCLEIQPDIVVLDVGLPGLNGIEVLRQLTARIPSVKVLIFSGKGSPSNIRELLSAGAQSYVDKMDGFQEFKKGLEIISAGGTFIGPKMASAMRTLIRNPESGRSGGTLSNRERQILQLVAESFSTREIAARLSLSVRTVDNHRTNIMRKLNLHNVAALTRYAIKHELVESFA